MKRLSVARGILMPLILTSFICCNVEDVEVDNSGHAARLARDKEIIEMLGHDPSSIFEGPEYYVVDGDILLKKDSLEKYFPDSTEVTTRNYYQMTYGVVTNKTRITIGCSSELSGWETAIRWAIDKWNSVADCSITFAYAGVNSGDIRVTKGDQWSVPGGTLSATERPSGGGNPGSRIVINTDYKPSGTAQRNPNLVHAIGHAIGFVHSWERGAERLTNITEPESATFMYIGHYTDRTWSNFSQYDLAAISTLYGSKKKENVSVSMSMSPNATTLTPGTVYTFTGSVTDAGGHYPNAKVVFTATNRSGGAVPTVTSVSNTVSRIVFTDGGEHRVTATIQNSSPRVSVTRDVTVTAPSFDVDIEGETWGFEGDEFIFTPSLSTDLIKSVVWSVTSTEIGQEYITTTELSNYGCKVICQNPGKIMVSLKLTDTYNRIYNFTKEVTIIPSLKIHGPEICYTDHELIFRHNQNPIHFSEISWDVRGINMEIMQSDSETLTIKLRTDQTIKVSLHVLDHNGASYSCDKDFKVLRYKGQENEITVNFGETTIKNIEGINWVCISLSLETAIPTAGNTGAVCMAIALPNTGGERLITYSNDFVIGQGTKHSNQDFVPLYPADQSYESSLAFISFYEMKDDFGLYLHNLDPLFYSFPLYHEEKISTGKFLDYYEIRDLVQEKDMPIEYLWPFDQP